MHDFRLCERGQESCVWGGGQSVLVVARGRGCEALGELFQDGEGNGELAGAVADGS